jgi:DNA ligase-1
MLSATIEDTSKLRLPLLASPKLDGIRAMILDGVVTSRNGKDIRNAYVQELFGNAIYNGLDGELIVGDPASKTCFRDTDSAVMSRFGEPNVTFHVFDMVVQHICFVDRLRMATLAATASMMRMVPHYVMEAHQDVLDFEEQCLQHGFEGIMLRSLAGEYKFGRSTLNEQGLMKLKRFKDSEALVIGVEERMHNANELKVSPLGYAARSSHQDNMVGRGDLGALLVRDILTEVEFSIGTGFDDALRKELWGSKPIGSIVKYKYFPTGSKDKPRFPVFMGFRDPSDM